MTKLLNAENLTKLGKVIEYKGAQLPNLSEYLLNGSFWTLGPTQQPLEIFGSG